jgi:hypothetical protein
MKVNFFDLRCQTSTEVALFGLCDNEDKTPSYISLNKPDKWNATVRNQACRKITHTAIDNCIVITRENGQMDNRCDCMLTYQNNIVFIELKNKGSDWIGDGINQIEATIQNFRKNHELTGIKHKRAFVANRKHPNFHVIDNETSRKFWDKHRVRLNIDSEIYIYS